jgi:hypothetical protein
MVSQEWKALSPDERYVWEEKARRDKARFYMEKSLYQGPWKIPKKSKDRKDPLAPKRPTSAFLMYSKDKRPAVLEKHPGMTTSGCSSILSKMWKEAPESERRYYLDQDEMLRDEYKKDLAEYKKLVAMNRQKREEIAMKAVDDGIIPEPHPTEDPELEEIREEDRKKSPVLGARVTEASQLLDSSMGSRGAASLSGGFAGAPSTLQPLFGFAGDPRSNLQLQQAMAAQQDQSVLSNLILQQQIRQAHAQQLAQHQHQIAQQIAAANLMRQQQNRGQGGMAGLVVPPSFCIPPHTFPSFFFFF